MEAAERICAWRTSCTFLCVVQARLKGLAPLISFDEGIAERYPRAVW
jgi:hypothetical protein